MNSNTLYVYGDQGQLNRIASAVPALQNEVIMKSDSWGPNITAKSISIPITLLLASGYSKVDNIDWYYTGTSTLPAQIWAKER